MVLFGSPVMSLYIYIYIYIYFHTSLPLSEVLSGCPHCCLNLVSLASLPEVLNGAHFHSIQHLLLWVGGVRGQSHGCLHGWRYWFPGLTVPVTCVYMSCSGWEAKVLCATSPAATGFSGAWGSAAIACGLEMQVQPPLFAPFCLPSGLVSPS